MMSNPLKVLSKYRKQPAKPKAKARGKSKKRAEPGSTPVEDLALGSVKDPWDVLKDFQTTGYYNRHDDSKVLEEDEPSHGRLLHGHPQPAYPVMSKAFKKSRLKDYRAGPVKIYTKAEIEEYEKERAHGTKV